ncbi:MAG: hypothetical protein H8E43_08505 [Planctomycetia bacterium]|nr:hypothetical protein [Planctomycetia bacterium]
MKTTGENVMDLARAMAIELTVEVPESVIDRYPDTSKNLVARIESVQEIGDRTHRLVLSFSEKLPGKDLTRWLNLLMGNCSMIPGVRLVDVEVPEEHLKSFRGPHHGIRGVRNIVGVMERPLVATALKPRGAPGKDLQKICREFVVGGGDVIKDDHNLIDDSTTEFKQRVTACVDTIRESQKGRHVLYLVNLMSPDETLEERLSIALEAGADGALLAPWVLGLDRTRHLIDQYPGVYLGHPSMSGILTSQGEGGFSLPVVHGLFARLAGLDGSVFVNAGGRFNTTREEGRQIAEKLRSPMGHVEPGWAIPAGGMTPDRISEMLEDYGSDSMILMGGALLAAEQGVTALTREIVVSLQEKFSAVD